MEDEQPISAIGALRQSNTLLRSELQGMRIQLTVARAIGEAMTARLETIEGWASDRNLILPKP